MVDDLKAQVPELRSDLLFEVVSNGARKSLYNPSTFDQRRQFRSGIGRLASVSGQRPIPPDKKLVGFVGRVENSKGLQLLEQLARAHADGEALGDVALLVQFRFHAGSPEYQTCMKNALRLRDINRDFIWVYPDQAPRGTDRPTRHFDLLLLPSLSEVQPMVVSEALSCGVPVVATRSTRFFDEMEKMNFRGDEFAIVELPERFGAGAQGIAELSEADDPPRIAHHLIDAINRMPRFDDSQRRALSGKADLVGFSDDAMYKRYLRIYHETVADFGRRVARPGRARQSAPG
jgi:glycosyltransferase involved in cell wall biosynthesis